MTKMERSILIFLLAFLGLGAIAGGGAFILAPGGEAIGMPLSILENSPFNDFLIPGIFLFTVLGICPFLLIIALYKKPSSSLAEKLNFFHDMHWSWSYTVFLSFVLILWIQIQMQFIQEVSWLHLVYSVLAVLILVIALLPELRKHYGK